MFQVHAIYYISVLLSLNAVSVILTIQTRLFFAVSVWNVKEQMLSIGCLFGFRGSFFKDVFN